jgi:CubicO group peptidase (beta-lactamase class C family)
MRFPGVCPNLHSLAELFPLMHCYILKETLKEGAWNMRSRIIGLAAIAAFYVLVKSGAAQEMKTPEAIASARLRAYIQAFNSGNADELKKFFETHYAASALQETSIEARLARFPAAKARLQSIRIENILAEQPFQTFALAKAGNGDDVLLRAAVEKEPPHKLLFIFLEPVDDPKAIVIPEPKANDQEVQSAVRAYLEAQTQADEFSGVVLIAKDSQVLFHEAYGMADREKNIPNRKDTKFNLGSINKIFTRASIYQLEQQGKLALRDPIKKFLPDYSNQQAAEKVTIQHLLDMTSGIGDFFGARYEATPKEKIRKLQDYLPLFADLPLEFEPGEKSRYSNGGYIVLGLIIEKASGMDYYDYVRENIFKPCGMLNTDSYARDAGVPNLAWGYTREGRQDGARVLNHKTLPGRGSSAGGGYSTAEDMLKYILALKEKKIYLPEIGGGLAIAGGAPGINSVVEWDPRRDYIVIVMTNFDPPTAGRTSNRILSWLPE